MMISKCGSDDPGLVLLPDGLLHLLDDDLLGGQTEVPGEPAMLVVVSETLS